mmetsp:Transcript_34459/g.91292  ORF Transcript_34459/g.91292 Transcript_34459/m.91292 type:complete len:276 (-) Transcript_34459:213-1040(-)
MELQLELLLLQHPGDALLLLSAVRQLVRAPQDRVPEDPDDIFHLGLYDVGLQLPRLEVVQAGLLSDEPVPELEGRDDLLVHLLYVAQRLRARARAPQARQRPLVPDVLVHVVLLGLRHPLDPRRPALGQQDVLPALALLRVAGEDLAHALGGLQEPLELGAPAAGEAVLDRRHVQEHHLLHELVDRLLDGGGLRHVHLYLVRCLGLHVLDVGRVALGVLEPVGLDAARVAQSLAIQVEREELREVRWRYEAPRHLLLPGARAHEPLGEGLLEHVP